MSDTADRDRPVHTSDRDRPARWSDIVAALLVAGVTGWAGSADAAALPGPTSPPAEDARRSSASEVDTTVAVRRGERLVVRVPEGSVRVGTGDGSVVRIVGRDGRDDRGGRRSLPRVGRDGEVVEVRLPSERDEWRITVPPWLPLELVGREVDAELVGLGAGVVARSADGDLEVRGLTGAVDLHAVRGDIRVADAEGALRLRTGDGEIDLVRVGGPTVAAETTDGDIRMSRMFAEAVKATTVDGDVTFDGRLVAGGRYELGTHDGDIVVALAADADVRVRATTWDGDLEPGFPVTIDGFRSGEPTVFTLGDGGSELILSSFSGDVRLVRNEGFDDSNQRSRR